MAQAGGDPRGAEGPRAQGAAEVCRPRKSEMENTQLTSLFLHKWFSLHQRQRHHRCRGKWRNLVKCRVINMLSNHSLVGLELDGSIFCLTLTRHMGFL